MTDNLEARAIEAAIRVWHGDINDVHPDYRHQVLAVMRAAIAAYGRVMREGRPETTLDQQLTLLVRSFDDPKSAATARAAIHALFQEAQANGK